MDGERKTAAGERVFHWQAPRIKFGPGAVAELGYELAALGVGTAVLVTDPGVEAAGLTEVAVASAARAGVRVHVYAGTELEPTDVSCEKAAQELAGLGADGYVGLGGGSSIDTAKIVNLLHAHPGIRIRDVLNRPVGAGMAIPGPLRPLIAVPTTAGTGSECTAMVALGLPDLGIKTGISDAAVRPDLAIVDPELTVSCPSGVTASSGYDVLTHACESYTARAYDARGAYASPGERPLYAGSNPISDIWAEQALRLLGEFFRRAVLSPWDLPARTAMSQAALFAGFGFGNAGTHVPHACAYPIAGRVRDYRAKDYPGDHAMIPHGQAVVVTAAEAFEFTFDTAPDRHLRAAELLGADVSGLSRAAARRVLPDTVRALVADTGGPDGVGAFGYTAADVPDLVAGALQQQRLLACCPRDVRAEDLHRVIEASL